MWNLELYIDHIEKRIKDEEAEGDKVRLHMWQAKTFDSVKEQCRWVKAKEKGTREEAPKRLEEIKHIRDELTTSRQEWLQRWTIGDDTRGDLNNVHFAEALTRDYGGPTTSTCEGNWMSAQGLERMAKKTAGKASGPDGWSASALTQLPHRFWFFLSQLWEEIICCGKPPRVWTLVRVALIPKDDADGGLRPISVASVLWRIGASLAAKEIGRQVGAWLRPEVQGCIPGRGIEHIHARIQATVWNKGFVMLSQDLSKFFDIIRYSHAAGILRWAGAPKLAATVLAFYGMGRRLLSVAGAVDTAWVLPERGIMQGCPLSPLIAALMGDIWCRRIRRSANPPQVAVYLDDRGLWASGPDAPSRLREADVASAEFDQRFCLTLNSGKCVKATAPGLPAQFLGQPKNDWDAVTGVEKTEFALLGMHFDLEEGVATVKRVYASRWHQRIALVSKLCIPVLQKARLIRVMVLPLLTWAAPYVHLDAAAIESFQATIALQLWKVGSTKNAAALLKQEILGWETNLPVAWHMAVFRAVSRLWCVRKSGPEWTDDLEIGFLMAESTALVPALATVMEYNGLGWNEARGEVTRRDAAGRTRKWVAGHDPRSVLFEWMVEFRRAATVQKASRLKNDVSRSGDDPLLAQGPNLAPPPPGCAFSGDRHANEYAHAGLDNRRRNHSLGCGLSCWHMLGAGAAKSGRDDPRRWCMCGRYEPSMPHLLWSCERTEARRAALCLRQPRDPMEERLLLVPLRQSLAPPIYHDMGQGEAIVDYVADALRKGEVALLASDGSAKLGAAAWAVVTNELFIGGTTNNEAALAYDAEVAGLRELLRVCAEAAPHAAKGAKVVAVLDCSNVARRFNDRADRCAKDVRARAYDFDPARNIWEGEKATAFAWMDKVFELAIAASDDYRDFIGASCPADGDQE